MFWTLLGRSEDVYTLWARRLTFEPSTTPPCVQKGRSAQAQRQIRLQREQIEALTAELAAAKKLSEERRVRLEALEKGTNGAAAAH